MATVNGNRYRTFGQGARRENEKKAADGVRSDPTKDGDGPEEHGDSKGQVLHVKQAESGEYHVKHPDGHVEKLGSKQEMLDHLDAHYSDDEESSDDYDGESDAGESSMGSLSKSVKSILG